MRQSRASFIFDAILTDAVGAVGTDVADVVAAAITLCCPRGVYIVMEV